MLLPHFLGGYTGLLLVTRLARRNDSCNSWCSNLFASKMVRHGRCLCQFRCSNSYARRSTSSANALNRARHDSQDLISSRIPSLKREVASLVGGFATAIRALTSQTFGRELGPRGDIVVGQRVGYLGISENRAAVLTGQRPACHRLKSSPGSM
jgi:hypothetical protein